MNSVTIWAYCEMRFSKTNDSGISIKPNERLPSESVGIFNWVVSEKAFHMRLRLYSIQNPKYGILSSKTYKRDSHINTALKMNNTDLRTFTRLENRVRGMCSTNAAAAAADGCCYFVYYDLYIIYNIKRALNLLKYRAFNLYLRAPYRVVPETYMIPLENTLLHGTTCSPPRL